MPWTDKGQYWVNTSPKFSNEWFNVRKHCITPSRMYSCCENYFSDTPETVAKYIAGVEKKVFTKDDQQRMDRGKVDEIDIRKYYEEKSGNKVFVFGEDEYPASKFDGLIRGVPDGLILNDDGHVEGVFEAKSKNRVMKSFFDVKEDYSHIPIADLYQVLGYMAMFKAMWCDYVVNIKSSDTVVIYRIEFSEEKWKDIYEKLVDFRERLLNPLLKKTPDLPV